MTRPSPRAMRVARVLVALTAGAALFALGWLMSGGTGAPTHDEHVDSVWTCSMHPSVRQPDPGDCPICGMDLIPAGDLPDDAEDPTRVTLSERARALAAVRSSVVRRQPLPADGALRLTGRVELAETGLATVTSWVPGRLERLFVETTGQRVRRGQVVARIFSPEIHAAWSELLVARRQIDRLADATELARRAAQANLDAARQRLALLGVPAAEIDRMARADAPERLVAIRAHEGGTVLERFVTEGATVAAGAPLYRVADLDTVWAQLDAYEPDLARLSVGDPVRLSVDAYPGEVFEGRVAFVDPVIDPRRRVARARVEVEGDGRLRPGMFVEAWVGDADEAADDAAAPLSIPRTAPLFTGRRSVVYVEVPDAARPTYEAREVRLGPRLGDVYTVVSGLAEGERVVTHGAFAIDADLQIRGGASMMDRGDDLDAAAVATPPALLAALGPTVTAYLDVTEALAADDLDAARAAAAAIVEAAAFEAPAVDPAALAAWAAIRADLEPHARALATADTIEPARAALEPLTADVVAVLRTFGNPTDAPVRLAHCPMALDDAGAEWVQRDDALANAYFGASMLTCGAFRGTALPGARLSEAPR